MLAQSATVRPALYLFLWQKNPAWQPNHGVCPACVLWALHQVSAERSPTSLHTTTDPQTTFPYYHLAEESVLAQAERLPDYATISGQGVTIAFLDSGYYPHPDLCTAANNPDPAPDWVTLAEQQWRTHLTTMQPRIAQYVDLADGDERIGVDQPSLWAGDGSSWHGQMTTVIAAGNGYLSGGHYRGYAPQARILPIKIGRQNGRIPEEDILRGLDWLLRDNNWRRYGVRVLNVSVGGDFRQPWHKNPVCLAAEELSQQGVLICAAAGNRGQEGLVAPAQAPSVLTVGGFEDHNQRWLPEDTTRLSLYHHNYGTVTKQRQRSQKPEILALGRYLPAPILPLSPIFAETATIGELRNALLGYDEHQSFPQRTNNSLLPYQRAGALWARKGLTWFPEIWQALRQRMNAHKWVHPFYQHVDGTSVAVAQVSAVAAQIFAANPQLTGQEVKALLLATALPLPEQLPARTGHGLLQPSQAVAAALHSRGGLLQSYPQSATRFHRDELQRWQEQGRVPLPIIPNSLVDQLIAFAYLGFYAPAAQAVSVIGEFNQWQPGAHALHRANHGWWHGLLPLPPGTYRYQFWVEELPGSGRWLADPENPRRLESGYREDHSLLVI